MTPDDDEEVELDDNESELETSLASILTEATSLTMVPILMEELFSSKCFKVVVLPDPKNPARRMVGMGCCCCDDLDGVEYRAVERGRRKVRVVRVRGGVKAVR